MAAMPNFRNPPLLSPNTAMATVVRFARAMGGGKWFVSRVLPLAFNRSKKARVFKGYQPTVNDVFVATYPKSGTNWAMQIALQIAHRGDIEYDHVYDLVAWPEAPFAGIVPLDDPRPLEGSSTGHRMIKVALEAEFVPYHEDAKYLVIQRDPKDALVSAYHFLLGFLGLLDDISIDEWFELYLSPNFPGGSWAEHTAGFWAMRDRPNVLVLQYTDMKRDLGGAVSQVAALMGVSLTPEEHAKVVEHSSFSYMKERDACYAPPRLPFTQQRVTMVRTGKVGGSKEILSAEQRAQVDEHVRKQLSALGSDFPYDELYGGS